MRGVLCSPWNLQPSQDPMSLCSARVTPEACSTALALSSCFLPDTCLPWCRTYFKMPRDVCVSMVGPASTHRGVAGEDDPFQHRSWETDGEIDRAVHQAATGGTQGVLALVERSDFPFLLSIRYAVFVVHTPLFSRGAYHVSSV